MTADEALTLAKTLEGKDTFELAMALVDIQADAYKEGMTALATVLGVKP